jgi:hypothetical protein
MRVQERLNRALGRWLNAVGNVELGDAARRAAAQLLRRQLGGMTDHDGVAHAPVARTTT